MGHGGAKGREFMGDTSQADQCVGVGVCGLVGAFQCQKLCVAHVPFQKMSRGLRAHLIPHRDTAPGQIPPFNCLNILGMPRDFVFTKVFLFLCLWTLSKELYRYLRGDTLYVPPGARWPGILSEYFLSAVI